MFLVKHSAKLKLLSTHAPTFNIIISSQATRVTLTTSRLYRQGLLPDMKKTVKAKVRSGQRLFAFIHVDEDNYR